MRRRSFLIGTGGLVATSALPIPALGQSADRIRLVQSNYGFNFVPVMTALERGHFAANGIEAEFIVNLGGAEALAATLSGDAEINVGATSSALRARAQGTDAKIFGTSMGSYSGNLTVTAAFAESRGVTAQSTMEEKLEALRGSTIAVIGLGSGTHQLMLYLAQEAGLNPDTDLQIMGIGQTSAVITAFEQGRIDGFIASSPSGETAIANNGGEILINTSAGDIPELTNFAYVTYIAKEEWLNANPDLVGRFTTAVDAALAELHAPETADEVRDLIYERYHDQTDRALFDGAWETTKPAWPGQSAVSRQSAENAMAFLNRFSADPYPEELLDTAFVY